MKPASEWTDHISGLIDCFIPTHMVGIYNEELANIVRRIQEDALNTEAANHTSMIRCCNHTALLDWAAGICEGIVSVQVGSSVTLHQAQEWLRSYHYEKDRYVVVTQKGYTHETKTMEIK
jgi:hypothetical protein